MDLIQPPLRKEPQLFLKPIQGICFYVIAFNLLWAYFEQSAFSAFFSLACLMISGLVLLSVFINLSVLAKLGNILCYVGFMMWSLLMIGVYGSIYSPHSIVNFLFFSMDGAAIFFLRLFISVLPCMIFVDYGNFTIDKMAKASLFIVLLTSAYFTSKAIAVNPDALRARGTMEYLGLEEVLTGTPGYAMTYAYSLFVPVLLHKSFTTVKRTRFFYGLCTAMVLYIVLVAQYATALLISIIGIVLYLVLVSKPKARLYIIFFTIIGGTIIWSTDGGSDIFYALASKVEGTWSTKLTDIALTLEGQSDSGSVSSRIDHYSESIDAFLKSPLLGMYWNSTTSIGEHATAIDTLGLAGIMGFIPMMLSIYGNFARMKNHPSYQDSKPAVIACIIEFLVLVFSKNIVTSTAIFFVFYGLIPLFLKAEEGVSNESAEKDNL